MLLPCAVPCCAVVTGVQCSMSFLSSGYLAGPLLWSGCWRMRVCTGRSHRCAGYVRTMRQGEGGYGCRQGVGGGVPGSDCMDRLSGKGWHGTDKSAQAAIVMSMAIGMGGKRQAGEYSQSHAFSPPATCSVNISASNRAPGSHMLLQLPVMLAACCDKQQLQCLAPAGIPCNSCCCWY